MSFKINKINAILVKGLKLACAISACTLAGTASFNVASATGTAILNCADLSGGHLYDTGPQTTPVIVVVEGDVIKVVSNISATWGGAGSGTVNIGTTSFTVGSGEAGGWELSARVVPGNIVTFFCNADGSATPEDVSSSGSTAMTTAAARVFSEGVHTTVASRFNGGGSFSGGASGSSVSGYASTSAMKQPQVLMAYGEDGQAVSTEYREQSEWNAWVRGEATGFADGGDTVLDGWSVVMSGGVDYRLAENVIIGLLFGYESAELDFDADASSFEGQGPSLGVYAGYQISEGLIFDITVAHSWLDYDIKSGTTTGEFDASRWLFAANLVGTIHVNDRVTIEPGVRIVYAIEDQDAFTLSDATAVASKTVNSGSASFGPTIYYALAGDMPEGSKVWASIKGNYDFSDQNVTSTTLPDFDGVFSARFGAGFQTYIFDTAKLDLSGEVSGVGSDEYTTYSGQVKIIVPLGGH